MIFNNLIKLLPKKARVEGVSKKVCNLKRSPADDRDDKYAVGLLAESSIPDVVILNEQDFTVKNQGAIGSCGSHAIANVVEYELKRNKPSYAMELSELFHYWTVRQLEWGGSFPEDSGQVLREGCKVANKVGICPEKLHPYDVSKFNDSPGLFAKSFARWWNVESYHLCSDWAAMRSELAQGHPVLFGIPVDTKFLSKRDANIVRNYDTRNKAGGHAMVVVGYDETKHAFKVLNSWGTTWGDKGYCWISYAYMQANLWEAWSVRV